MPKLNLDELRAARKEKQKEPIEIVFNKKTYQLAQEIPISVGEDISKLTEDGANALPIMLSVLEKLLGDKQWKSFNKDDLTTQDILAFFEAIGSLYGFADSGE